jgi:hypothetical protein
VIKPDQDKSKLVIDKFKVQIFFRSPHFLIPRNAEMISECGMDIKQGKLHYKARLRGWHGIRGDSLYFDFPEQI